jgi:hypothetical protein
MNQSPRGNGGVMLFWTPIILLGLVLAEMTLSAVADQWIERILRPVRIRVEGKDAGQLPRRHVP